MAVKGWKMWNVMTVAVLLSNKELKSVTDEFLGNGLMSKMPVVHQRTNGNLHKIPAVYYGEGCGHWEPSEYNVKETDRARTEQSDVNNFSSYVYFMYVNQLEHKKGMMENNLQKTVI